MTTSSMPRVQAAAQPLESRDKVSVDTTGYVGRFTSIAIDSNDAVHISYIDVTNYDLKYATCSSGCTTASNWDKVSIDTTGIVGVLHPPPPPSIAIDSNDALHISYESTNDDLKYATDSSGWLQAIGTTPRLTQQEMWVLHLNRH